MINAIIGKEIVIEGKDLKGETQYVTSYSTEIHDDVQYNIWDSSGLQDRGITDKVILDKITTKLVQQCTHIHLLVHCLRMDTDRIEKNDELAIMRLTDIFGPKIWDMSVIALTYANKVEPPPDSDEDSAMRETFFKQRPIDYREKIIKILIKCQLNEQKASEIAVIPTGYHKPTRNRPNPSKVLDIEDWLNPFWIKCAERMKETAIEPLIRTQRELEDKLLPDPEVLDEVTEVKVNCISLIICHLFLQDTHLISSGEERRTVCENVCRGIRHHCSRTTFITCCVCGILFVTGGLISSCYRW